MEQQTTPCADLVWSNATDKIIPALLSFQANPPKIVKEGIQNVPGRPERKYITLDSILHAVRPELAKLDLFIMQHLAGSHVVTEIIHKSGQFVRSFLPFQTMNGSGTNNLQNLGGGLTYLRRYALTAILAIAADEDDDGNAGGIETKTASNEPTKWLNKLDKSGNLTPEWKNLIKGIEMGTVGSLAEIRKFYKVAKKEAEEIEKLLKPVAA